MVNVLEKLKVLDRPRGDKIVVLPILAATASSIVIADEGRERPERGIVLAVGDGMISPESGRVVTVESKPGELVSFGKYAGSDIEIQGDGYSVKALVMRDCEVLLYREADSFELTMHDDDPRKIHLAGLTCAYCPKVSAEDHLDALRRIASGVDDVSVTTVG